MKAAPVIPTSYKCKAFGHVLFVFPFLDSFFGSPPHPRDSAFCNLYGPPSKSYGLFGHNMSSFVGSFNAPVLTVYLPVAAKGLVKRDHGIDRLQP